MGRFGFFVREISPEDAIKEKGLLMTRYRRCRVTDRRDAFPRVSD